MPGPAGKLLVLQAGGPTAVLNTTLFGVIDEARRHAQYDRILGARFGMEGLLRDDWVDLSALSTVDLQRLQMTPGAALGTSRHKPADAEFEQIVDRLRNDGIGALLLIGGNGTLRAAATIAQAADRAGYDLSVIGIPKTVDNDIPSTDRCPGYGSAARYVAQSVRDLGMDLRALPQPVSIFETMGRGVGWLAAASVLAKFDERSAPHLVYLPETPFEPDQFLSAVDRVVERLGWAVVVVSEGLRNADGTPVFEVPDATQRDAMNRALPGGVASHLANLVTHKLKIRCRCEKPGLCGRASMLHVSPQDLADAELVGHAGVRASIEGGRAQAVALRPLDATGADAGYEFVPLARAAGERAIPAQWLAGPEAGGVTPDFVRYAGRIVGDLLPYATPLAEAPAIAMRR